MPKGNKEFTQIIFDGIKNPRLRNSYGKAADIIEVIAFLINLRTEKGLTQRELALRAGMAQSAIARLESGRVNPTLTQLIKVAHALDHKIKITKNRED